MKILKKFAISLLLAMMLMPVANATTFTDVSGSSENYTAIEYLVSIGTLQGYGTGEFKPDQTINRAELMKVLVAGQEIDPDAGTYQNCFPDVTNEWFAKYVCYANQQGWVDGYPDGTFKPGQTVNRVEASKMIVNAYSFTLATESSQSSGSFMFTDVSATDWFYGYVMALTDAYVIDRDASSSYSPGNDMSRGNVAEYIFRSLVVQSNEYSPYTAPRRDEFLNSTGTADLIPEGLAAISAVFYDGEVYQVESDEYVEIKNTGQGTLQLESYFIMGSKGEEKYSFPSLELAPGETIKVYTNQGDYSFESEDALWSNNGETVYLYDDSGNLVDSYSF